MTPKYQPQRHILVIDCCEHVLSVLKDISNTNFASISSNNSIESSLRNNQINLIVIGLSRLPMRRLFFSRLRRFFPEVPMLILRREKTDYETPEEWIRGEFLLSDRKQIGDLEIVKSIREVLPFEPCKHLHSSFNYDLIREVTRFIADNYSDPDLHLEHVAKELLTTPTKLSRTLNQKVGISFPQLLRNIRVQEAKHLLASQKYSVKEVSAKVGFSDSHYFSRVFKEATGVSPSEYEYSPQELVFS